MILFFCGLTLGLAVGALAGWVGSSAYHLSFLRRSRPGYLPPPKNRSDTWPSL